jgi:uracil permease
VNVDQLTKAQAAAKQWGLPGTIAGLTSVSLVYFIMSALVKWQGKKLLDKIFPPVVIGPAIILIGLSLSGSAVNMAKTNWVLAFASLITAILVLTFCKGLMKLVPIISGVIVGYVIAICMGEVDFSDVAAASWFSCPVSFDTIPFCKVFHFSERFEQVCLFLLGNTTSRITDNELVGVCSALFKV